MIWHADEDCQEEIIAYGLMLFIPCSMPIDICIMEANPAEVFFVFIALTETIY